MSDGARGNNRNRHPFKRKNSEKWNKDGRKGKEKPRFDKNKGILFDRPKWEPPELGRNPIPKPICPYCGKPIQDYSAAINDRETGQPVHFDCVRDRIAQNEQLSEGDTITYIGGGRFGIVHFPVQGNTKEFEIKKILQWEEKDKRSDWRNDIADNFSST